MKYISRKNIGWLLTAMMSFALLMSAYGMLTGDPNTVEMMKAHNLGDWTTVIGFGELISLILFIYPKTMNFGAMLLAAFLGGAIMFRMTHPDPEMTGFKRAASFFMFLLIVSWIRGLELVEE